LTQLQHEQSRNAAGHHTALAAGAPCSGALGIALAVYCPTTMRLTQYMLREQAL
jgi:hypothetical protein